MKLDFDKVNLVNLIVASMLCISLVTAIFCSQEQLAMSIASGLLGFIGGTAVNKNDGWSRKDD